MYIVSIYANKGGVGKSTLTVGLAEFLAANRKQNVLVIDLDAQASSSGALLGKQAVAESIRLGTTLPNLVRDALKKGRRFTTVSDFVTTRPASSARGSALARLGVVVPEKPGIIALEEDMSANLLDLRRYLHPALAEAQYDFVLIDFPGNIDRRHRLAIALFLLSDFVLIPVEPTDLALSSLPDTMAMIQEAATAGNGKQPQVLGFVLNKTDKRTQQFRERMKPILEVANNGKIPPVFDNFLPDTPKLCEATDGIIDWSTLKERFSTYYDNVRKVAKELEDRCNEFTLPPTADAPSLFRNRIQEIFAKLIRRG